MLGRGDNVSERWGGHQWGKQAEVEMQLETWWRPDHGGLLSYEV